MKRSFQSFFYITALLTIAAMTACKSDKPEPKPETQALPAATITVEEPDEGVTIEFDDTVHMHVHITGVNELHGWELALINMSEGDTVFDAHEHDHAMSFDIEEFWVNEVTDHSDMELRVRAIVDHDDNYVEKVVHFHCHPM